jgi:hypothetical protein
MHGTGLEPERRSALLSLRDLGPLVLEELDVIPPSSWSSKDVAEGESPYVLTECVYDCRNPLPPENRRGPRLVALQDGLHKLVVDFRSGQDAFFDVEEGRDHPLERSAISKKKRADMYRTLLDQFRGHRCDYRSKVQLMERLGDIRRSMAE